MRRLSEAQIRWLLSVRNQQDPFRHYVSKHASRGANMVRAQLVALGLLDTFGRLTEAGRKAAIGHTQKGGLAS